MLVELEVFSSRSEALRELIEAGLDSYKSVVRIAKAVEKLFELEKEKGDTLVKLNGALKQLPEEREPLSRIITADRGFEKGAR